MTRNLYRRLAQSGGASVTRLGSLDVIAGRVGRFGWLRRKWALAIEIPASPTHSRALARSRRPQRWHPHANGMVRRRNTLGDSPPGTSSSRPSYNRPSPYWASDGRLRRERDSGRLVPLP